MIVGSQKRGYQVKSEGGKNLSKKGLSRGAAKKRLEQVEYFKAGGKSNSRRFSNARGAGRGR